MENVPDVPAHQCSPACQPHDDCKNYPVVDQESTARLALIKAQDGIQNRALSFSMVLSASLITCYIIASFVKIPLILPDVIWQLIWISVAAPWVGAGGGKIADAISKKIEAKK